MNDNFDNLVAIKALDSQTNVPQGQNQQQEQRDVVSISNALITVSDPISLSQTETVNTFTSSLVNLTSVVDSFSNLKEISEIPLYKLLMKLIYQKLMI